jgi:hypothetical protein
MTTDGHQDPIPAAHRAGAHPPPRLDEGWPVSAISREDLQRHRPDNRTDVGLRPG